eukprot:4551655-Karenia_brevis.AAC.1
MGIRACFVDVMEGLRFHMDVQFCAAGEENCWAAYNAKYISKFSDSWSDEVLDDDTGMTGDATAAAVLT